MPSPVPAEPAADAAKAAPTDPHDRELRGLALTLTDGTGFRLAIATFGDTGVRDALIDRLAATLTAAGAALSCLDVALLVPAADQVARQEFSLLAALRRHYEGLAVGQPGGRIAISVAGLEQFISEFSEGGFDVLQLANLQRELFPRACPVPIVIWLPPWATTLLAQEAPDLWHWRTATFDFPGGGPPPSALTAWPRLTREEWWRPVDGERLGELTAELETLRQREGTDTSPRARAYAARLRLRLADALYPHGEWDRALALLEEARQSFAALGDERSRAVTMGKIADILARRGQLDEALRIGEEEELPVYERLGDVRELLVARANLATTLHKRDKPGDRDEAKRLLCLALAEARRLRLPEATEIEKFMADAGLACD